MLEYVQQPHKFLFTNCIIIENTKIILLNLCHLCDRGTHSGHIKYLYIEKLHYKFLIKSPPLENVNTKKSVK